MASSLDLQEQEQLDSLKAFWRQYGNLITLALALGFAVVAGINGWNLWQRKQAENAAARVDQLEAAVQAGDARARRRSSTTSATTSRARPTPHMLAFRPPSFKCRRRCPMRR